MNRVAYQDSCVLFLSGGFAYPAPACGLFEVVKKTAQHTPSFVLMVWDAFQEHVSCILRRGGRPGWDVVLTPIRAFSAEFFLRSAMSFPTHPLTFSLRRFGFAAEHITADQVVHTPARILPQLSVFQFPTSHHVVPTAILKMGSTPDKFSKPLREQRQPQ